MPSKWAMLGSALGGGLQRGMQGPMELADLKNKLDFFKNNPEYLKLYQQMSADQNPLNTIVAQLLQQSLVRQPSAPSAPSGGEYPFGVFKTPNGVEAAISRGEMEKWVNLGYERLE